MNKELEQRLVDKGLGIVLSEIAKSYSPQVHIEYDGSEYCQDYILNWFFMKDLKTEKRNLVIEFSWHYRFNKGFYMSAQRGHVADTSNSIEKCELIVLPENKEWKLKSELPELPFSDKMDVTQRVLYESANIPHDENAPAPLKEDISIKRINLFSRYLQTRSSTAIRPPLADSMQLYREILKNGKDIKSHHWSSRFGLVL